MINFDRISDNLYVGTCPGSLDDILTLVQAGVRVVINLQSDADFAAQDIDWPVLAHHYLENGVDVNRYPMIDFDESNIECRLREAAMLVNQVVNTGQPTYLHCTAGRERSPTTAAAWLTLFCGRAPDEALQEVMNARKCRPYRDMVLRLSGS